MKFKKDLSGKKWAEYALALCIAILFYVILINLGNIFHGIGVFFGFISPAIYGLIIAYVINPIVKAFERSVFKNVKSDRLRRNLSILVALLVIVALFALLLVALIPQLVKSIQMFITNLDTYVSQLQALLNELTKFASSRNLDISSATSFGENMLNNLLSYFEKASGGTNIIDTSLGIGKNIFNIIISCILAIYFLADKVRLQNGFKRLMRSFMSEKIYKTSGNFWARCNTILIRYIVCDLLDGLIVGLANAAFMGIMRMPYSVIVSVVVGVTNLAPTFGPIAGAVIGAFILVLVNPWYALWFLIFTIILQTMDGYVLKPKLFGGTLGVPGVYILICIIVGGRMFGVAGILLAIPFAAISDFMYHDFLELREKKKAEKETLPTNPTEKP